MNNKKSVMQKIVIAISALVIIACSITTISLAWFTDTKIGTTVLQFGKIDIDETKTFGGTGTNVFTTANLLASMELNTQDLLIDLTEDSNPALVRARFEIGLPIYNESPVRGEDGTIENGAEVIATVFEEIEGEEELVTAEGVNVVYENMKDKVKAALGLEDADAVPAKYVNKAYNAYIQWVKEQVIANLEEEGGRPARIAYTEDENGNLTKVHDYQFAMSAITGDPHYYLADTTADALPLEAKQDVRTVKTVPVEAEMVGQTVTEGQYIYTVNGDNLTKAAVNDTITDQHVVAELYADGYVFAEQGTFKVRNTANQITVSLEDYKETEDTVRQSGKVYYELVGENYEVFEGEDITAKYELVNEGKVVEYAQYNCELACMLTAEAMQASVVAEQDIFPDAENTYEGIALEQHENGPEKMIEKGLKYANDGESQPLTKEVFAAMCKIAFEQAEEAPVDPGA